MYGEITGRIALIAVIFIVCALRVIFILYRFLQEERNSTRAISVIIQIIIAILIFCLAWKILWR